MATSSSFSFEIVVSSSKKSSRDISPSSIDETGDGAGVAPGLGSVKSPSIKSSNEISSSPPELSELSLIKSSIESSSLDSDEISFESKETSSKPVTSSVKSDFTESSSDVP